MANFTSATMFKMWYMYIVCTNVVPAFVFKIKPPLNNLHCVNLTDLVQILFSEISFLFPFSFSFLFYFFPEHHKNLPKK